MDSVISEEFYCVICSRIMIEPVIHNSCKNSVCDECLNAMLVADVNSVCPVCRGPFTSNTLSQNHSLKNKIHSTLLTCRCGQSIPATHYDSHLDACPSHLASLSSTIQSIKKPSTTTVNRLTFTCPICSLPNLSQEALLKHFSSYHKGASGVCPICASMPWGDPNYISSDLAGHLKLRHKYDVSTFTEFGQEDEDILQAVLAQSMYER